jgi:hypothetical protein
MESDQGQEKHQMHGISLSFEVGFRGAKNGWVERIQTNPG